MKGELCNVLPNVSLFEDAQNEISGLEQSWICKRISRHLGATGSQWHMGKNRQNSEVLCEAEMGLALKTQSNHIYAAEIKTRLLSDVTMITPVEK